MKIQSLLISAALTMPCFAAMAAEALPAVPDAPVPVVKTATLAEDIDMDKSGKLTAAEFQVYAEKIAKVADQQNATFKALDSDRDGLLTPQEVGFTDAKAPAFHDADANADGVLDSREYLMLGRISD